jgi:hypothetical protein
VEWEHNVIQWKGAMAVGMQSVVLLRGAELRAYEDVEETRQNQSLPMQGLRSLQGVDTNSSLRI